MHPSTASTPASYSNYSPCNVLMNLQVGLSRGGAFRWRRRLCLYFVVCMHVSMQPLLACMCKCVCVLVFVTPDQACFSVRRLNASQGCVSISRVHSCLTVSEI